MTKRIEDKLLDALETAGSVTDLGNDFVRFKGKIDLRILAVYARRAVEAEIVEEEWERFLQEA